MDISWTRLGLTVLAGGVVSSLTDWLFMGDLLYRRSNKYPEIWRFPGGHGEAKAIAWSSPLPFLTCAVFVLLCSRLNIRSYGSAFKLALEIWLICPLPLILTNALFMKLQPMIAAAHSVDWLVKLCVAAIAVVVVLG